MRRITSSTGSAANWAGAVRSALSMVSCTSAWLREGRPPEPAKITSSMPPARIALAELAPITQRSASRRLDLPQPFGPTMPVSPGSMRNSVGSTKDLKPERRSRWKCTRLPDVAYFAAAWAVLIAVARLASDCSPSSTLPLTMKVGVPLMWSRLT